MTFDSSRLTYRQWLLTVTPMEFETSDVNVFRHETVVLSSKTKRKKCNVLPFDKAMEARQEVQLTENSSAAEANNNNRAASNYVEVA